MALGDNIIHYYKLDESSGNASDAVGSKTLTNNNTVGYATGKINNGADFGSSNSNKDFSIPTNFTDLNSNTAFSFSFWIKTNSSSSMFVGTRCNSSAFAQWNILINGESVTGSVLFQIHPTNNSSDSLYVRTGDVSINNNSWHHVVITYDGSRNTSGAKIYIDGSSVSVTSLTNTLSSNAPTAIGGAIGSRTSTFGSYFSGMIDEFAVWTRELSSTDVTQLYNSGNGNQYPFSIAYTIVCALGTFVLTGYDTNFVKTLSMIAGQGSFVLTGIDIALRRGFGLVLDYGSYVLTGIATMLRTSAWTKQAKPSTSWSNENKPTTNWTQQNK